MKLRKILPILSLSTIVTSMPIALTSCSNQHANVNVVNGYTPKTKQKEAYTFANYEEATDYYRKLDKNILIDDYLWTIGQRVKSKFITLPAILPFEFTNIDLAVGTVEQWWTQPNKHSNVYFDSTFSMIVQLSGETKPIPGKTDPQFEYAYVTLSLFIKSDRLPYSLSYVTDEATGINEWFIWPCMDKDLVKDDPNWSLSATASLTYKKKYSHDETVTRADNLGVYWNKDHMYDPETAQKSDLYQAIYDTLFYRSYHLENCKLA